MISHTPVLLQSITWAIVIPKSEIKVFTVGLTDWRV